MILRFYILFPLEQRLLELLVLRLRNFCTLDRGVCLCAKRSEFLFERFGIRKKVVIFRVSTSTSLQQSERNAYEEGALASLILSMLDCLWEWDGCVFGLREGIKDFCLLGRWIQDGFEIR